MNNSNHALLTILALAALAGQPAGIHAGSASPRDAQVVAKAIDREIDSILRENKIPSSPRADDAEFLRRLSLDLHGRIPTAQTTADFLADRDPDKRRKLVDRLLADPLYGEHFGTIWYHALVKQSTENQFVISNKLQGWLATRFNADRGWDSIVHDILTASGERDDNPATVFWLAHLQDKRLLPPERVTASAARLFLGIRLECCECHNHPYDTLKQTDFWGLAAFFATTHLENAAKKQVQAGEVPAVVEDGVIRRGRKDKTDTERVPPGSIVIPDSHGRAVKARFLLGETPVLHRGEPLRTVFADWGTAADNPYFARAAVNRLWSNFFGRGLVNPVDDMRLDSRTHHADLLKMLAEEFTASRFDLKHLIRCICTSQAYQRTSMPLPENQADEELFSHMKLKPMTADMLFDSLTVALDHEPAGKEGKGKKGGLTKIRYGPRDQFRRFFNAEADDDAGIVEDYTHGIPQVLRLMNSGDTNSTGAVIARLLKSSVGPEAVLRSLYLRVLSRLPTEAEVGQMQHYVSASRDVARGYEDVLWVLLNSSEFLSNH